MWKAVQRAFDVVGNSLAWQVGSGNSLHIGRDPWAGCSREHILPDDIFTTLKRNGYFHLSQLVDPTHTTLWQQGWKSGRTLELSVPQTIYWDRYLTALRKANIHLTDGADELIWDGDPRGTYTPKVGYVLLSITQAQQEEKWWWKRLWKLQCPAKGKLLVWSILENKVPTQHILQKKLFHEPIWCPHCHSQEETIDYLFMRCPFSSSVWSEASTLNPDIGNWHGDTFETTLKYWLKLTTPNYLKALPILKAQGI